MREEWDEWRRDLKTQILHWAIRCLFCFRRKRHNRNNHSTALALTDLIFNISSTIDKNETTLGIALDLSKAFDTINHEIMCENCITMVFETLLWIGLKVLKNL